MDPELIAQHIREFARELGFPACGFARAEMPPHADAFARWLEGGGHAGMNYLVRTLPQRVNPRLLIADARTIIVLGSPYAVSSGPLPTWREELRGRIASYALGVDYHEDLGTKLRELCGKIMSLVPGVRCRWSVDAGAVLERDWATVAGLGWQGRNTNVLTATLGSYFFLACILVNLELPPDSPAPHRCGGCVRCLPSCPTGALSLDYRLDARRCISYWTIEHRGTIPPAIRSAVQDWVFGCDLCQEVCPWNSRRKKEGESRRQEELYPFLPELLRLSEDGFRMRYRKSALWRARREGIARNAAVVLGNSGNPDAVPVLAEALVTDPSKVVRAHAAWALGQIRSRTALDRLYRALEREAEPEVRAEIYAALEGEPKSLASSE